jgi:hypothetical protein
MSDTWIKFTDIRPGDVVNVVYERDGHGVQSIDNFTVVKVEGDQLYFGSGRYDYIDTISAGVIDHFELVDRPKPVIKVGDRVRHTRTTEYGTVLTEEWDVHAIIENLAGPREWHLPSRRVEDLELVTEQ